MKDKPLKNIYIIIGAAALIMAALFISYFRLLDDYELKTLDARFRIRGRQDVTDIIVIVEIGEDTIRKLGRFPFDRTYHALLVKALHEFGAKAIAFDVLFSEAQEHDAEFKKAIRDAGCVYLPNAFDIAPDKKGIPVAKGYLSKCIPELADEAKGTGFINIIPDPDGKFRRVLMCIEYEDKLFRHFSAPLVMDYLGIDREQLEFFPSRSVRIGRHTIPLDDNSDLIVNFSGKWGEVYSHYSYVDILQTYLASITGEKPILNKSAFKDKVCIVGLTASGTGDVHPTPFEPLYPGVGIHAEIFNSIIKDKYISRISRINNIFLLFLVGIVAIFVTLRTRPIIGLTAVFGMILIYFLAAVLLFNIFGLWIDAAFPVIFIVFIYIVLTLRKYITERRNNLIMENELGIAKRIQESFLPHVNPSIHGVDVAAGMLTARKVGGDLYDFVNMDESRFGVMVGDVSGKGIPASLFMAMVSGSFRSFAVPKAEPANVLRELNAKLVKESSSNLFVTLFYAVFDMNQKEVAFANGGHLPMLRLGSAGTAEFFDTSDGMPLGLMEGDYAGGSTFIRAGDIFVFYTDGATEAMNRRGEMFGKERLAESVRKNMQKSASDIVGVIVKTIREFEPAGSQHDDITVIVIKVKI